MKRLIYFKNWQSLDLLVSPLKKLSSHNFSPNDETWYIHFVYIIRLSNIFMIKHKQNHVSFIEFIIWRKVNKAGLSFTSHKYCYITSFIHDRCHCQSKQSLPSVSLVAIYSWLPNNCLCIERCSSQQCEKNVLEIVQSQRTVLKLWQFYSLVFQKAEDVLISVYLYEYIFKIVIDFFLFSLIFYKWVYIDIFIF